MKQIRSDELWGNYSIAGKSTASFDAARLTSTGNARRVCGIIGKQGNGVTKADFQKYGCQDSEL